MLINRRTARSTSWRLGLVGLAGAVLAGLLVEVPASAAPTQAASPATSTTQQPQRRDSRRRPVAPARRHAWPADRSVTVPWPAAGPRSLVVEAGGAQASSVDGVVSLAPVAAASAQVSAAAASSAPGAWAGTEVTVLDRGTSEKLGVNGLSVVVRRPARRGALRVTLDASAPATALGGDWVSRAHLVELTGCSVTDGSVSGCTGRRPLTGSKVSGTKIQGVLSPASASSSLGVSVVAFAAAAGGSAGDYSATSMGLGSSWSAGGQNGGFSWSYPLVVPDVPSGDTPQLAVSYDSSSVDGKVSSTNNQTSWLGDGFDLTAGGFIERRYANCADDVTGGNGTATGDLCWKTDNATLSMAGRSGQVVMNKTTGVMRLLDDDNTKIERVGQLGKAGEYWKVTTADGTVYTFGKGTPAVGTEATNSAWTVPVASNHTGEPCNQATFAASICSTVYRWNLDSVVDRHGNAVSYFYVPESNVYGANGNRTVMTYTRGGYLSRIDYGLRTDSTSTQPAARVVFSTAERCVPGGSVTCAASQLTSSTSASWPDVPFDQICTAALGSVSNPATGGCPQVTSPAFFSRVRLTGVTTRISTGTNTFRDIDRYTFGNAYLDPGDVTTSSYRILWLKTINRVGVAVDGSTLSSPQVTLQPMTAPMPNRVDAIGDNGPPINRFRLGWVDYGTGGQVSVQYSKQDCTPTSHPAATEADMSTNTRRCFPVYYTNYGATQRTVNWFHKYVVTQVHSTDQAVGSGETVVRYQYVGAPAWHFDRDDLVPAKWWTWGQWRGYTRVLTFSGGNQGPWAATESRFMRGMYGDCLTLACTSTSPRRGTTDPAAKVGDSRGGSLNDLEPYNGFERETITYNGATLTLDNQGDVTNSTLGRPVSETLNTPALTTGSVTDGTLTAQARVTSGVSSRVFKADGTLEAEANSSTTFDTYGAPVKQEDAGTSAAGDETCTTTTYASDQTSWIISVPVETVKVKGLCSATPSMPTDLIAASRSLYDGATTWSATPTLTKGDLTSTQVGTAWNATVSPARIDYRTASSTGYDAVGRVTAMTDADGQTTSTAYVPSGAGPLTQVTMTAPKLSTQTAGFTVIRSLDPGRGTPVSIKDENGKVTVLQYDALARLRKVWLNTPPPSSTPSPTPTATWQPPATPSGDPDRVFDYSYGAAPTQTTAGSPTKVTSKALLGVPQGGTTAAYSTSVSYYDGLMRQVQTDSQSAISLSSRVVSGVLYDSRGFSVETWGPWGGFTGAPGSGLVNQYDPAIDARTTVTYDGAGRQTVSDVRAQTGAGVWTSRKTTTSYDGLTTTVVPPAGGAIRRRVADVGGNTTKIVDFTTTSGTAGASQESSYSYSADGKLMTAKDPNGNVWSRSYNLLGQIVSTQDPDHGATSLTYDVAGRVATSKDAHGTVAYKYDEMGRKTEEWLNAVGTGVKLASWTYDPAGGKGQLASSTRYANGQTYTRSFATFDRFYNPGSSTLSVSDVTTGLSGTYTTQFLYDQVGRLTARGEPAVAGGSVEPFGYTYTPTGLPNGIDGAGLSYVFGASYTPYGELSTVLADTAGSGTRSIKVNYGYELGTHRLASRSVEFPSSTGSTVVDQMQYGYNDAGLLTRAVNIPGGGTASTTSDTQCFSYDALEHLVQAWTPASAAPCDTAPSQTGLGGPAPYWSEWTVDPATGLRTKQVEHKSTGDVTTTYDYPAKADLATIAGGFGPHAMKAATVVAGGTSTPTTFTYDAAGSMASRKVGTTTTQTYSWDESGRLAETSTAAGKVSQLYDADGSLVLKRTPTEVTLYVDDMTEMVFTPSTGQVKARRTVEFGGQTIAVREQTASSYLKTTFYVGDPHGTSEIEIESVSMAITRRRTLPFGEPRGTAPTDWLSDRGFVGGVQDATTGLTQLGARPYDPVLGIFIATDPVMDYLDPGQWNPYGYAHHSPTSASDPTGEWTCSGREACAAIEAMHDEQDRAANYSAARSGNYGSGSSSGPRVSSDSGDSGDRSGSGGGEHKPKKKNWFQRNWDKGKKWASEHKAEIVSTAVGIGVGIGCGLVVGWTGVAAVGCAALSGAVSSLVSYGMTTPPDEWSVGGALTSATVGAAVGVATFGLFKGAGAVTGAVVRQVGSRAAPALSAVGAKLGPAAGKAMSLLRSGAKTTSRAAESGCFVVGTLVATEHGDVPIEKIRVGDRVWASDPKTGRPVLRTVTATFRRLAAETVRVQTGASSVTTTAEHPFYVEGRGWVPAGQLRPGDVLRTLDAGAKVVTAVQTRLPGAEVYNLTVDVDHTYYVGADHELVHNSCDEVVEGAKRTFLDRHGRLTDGKYTVDAPGMAPHTSGSTTSGKSQFLFGLDVESAVLKAAQFADDNNLWNAVGKAKVLVENGPIGVTGKTGELTSWLNVYRTRTGFVHGAPGGSP